MNTKFCDLFGKLGGQNKTYGEFAYKAASRPAQKNILVDWQVKLV
jgi:hypothetical protein